MAEILKGTNLNLLILCCIFFPIVHSWNTDELEVFDAVDEIKRNFYTLLDVPQNADVVTIRKSFRKLSLAIHPDHNPSPTADQEFRHLVSAYDILRSPEKRQYYDNILENGLPDWRQAVFYYRRVRKMGLQEMCLILTVIISVGQYLVAWASYLEKKFTLKELMKSKDKKSTKKIKKNKNESQYSDGFIESVILKPSIRNTLPFQIFYLLKELIIAFIKLLMRKTKEFWNRKLETKEQIRQRSEPSRLHEKSKKINFVPELIERPSELKTTSIYPKNVDEIENTPIISGGLWTDDDILILIKLVKKHPPGEPERWIKIASTMNRTVPEVTHMANKIKENDFRIPPENEEQLLIEEPKRIKTKGGKLGSRITEGEESNEKVSAWTQVQQKALEMALNKYSKKAAGDRWEKIANCVPGKSKEECILRYKKIANAIRQKKVEENNEEEPNENSTK